MKTGWIFIIMFLVSLLLSACVAAPDARVTELSLKYQVILQIS